MHTHLKKLFHSSWFSNGHDNFIRVYMLKSLSGNVISTTEIYKTYFINS